MSVDYYKCESCEQIQNDWEDRFGNSCGNCGNYICKRCQIDEDTDEDEYWDLPEENCPFCTGNRTHPLQKQFINGYLAALRIADVKRIYRSTIHPLLDFKHADLDLSFAKYIDKETAESLADEQKGTLNIGAVTDEDIIAILKRREGELIRNILTHEYALRFLNDPDLSVNEFELIEDKAAAALAKYDGDVLELHGLTEFSDSAAESLSKFESGLGLDGMTELSDSAVESLSTVGGYLSLAGLTELSDPAAKSLSRVEGDLCLESLTELTDFAAESLSKVGGNLFLGGLTKLSDPAAESLSKIRGILSLRSLTELSDPAAEFLSKVGGGLGLTSLAELSDQAAESLSRIEGDLYLGSLTELTDSAAESLSNVGGSLYLDGLTELSDSAAESLSRVEGDLSLDCITELTDSAANSLSKHKGPELCFRDLSTLSQSAAASLGEYKGEINGQSPKNFISGWTI